MEEDVEEVKVAGEEEVDIIKTRTITIRTDIREREEIITISTNHRDIILTSKVSLHQITTKVFENEMKLRYTPMDNERFMEKWENYTEQQTLKNLVTDVHLIKLKQSAFRHIRAKSSDKDRETEKATKNGKDNDTNPKKDGSDESEGFLDDIDDDELSEDIDIIENTEKADTDNKKDNDMTVDEENKDEGDDKDKDTNTNKNKIKKNLSTDMKLVRV